jgi:hypothetical protein
MELTISKDDPQVAYLYLSNFPRNASGKVVYKQICITDCIDGYKGPVLYFDFDENDQLIGIDIME